MMDSNSVLEKDVHQTRGPRPSSSRSLSSKTLEPVELALDSEASVIPDAVQVQPAASQPEAPPNGGLLAWTQVMGSFFLFFNCWGTINAFGVFQTYYQDNPYWKETPSNISWIGSVQAFLLLMVGVITGPLYDKGYFRHLIVTGGFLVPFGFMMTSLCRTYWQTMLSQGLLIGIGNGCLFVPSVAILPQYFSTRKSLANGIAASGSSFGGIIYPIAFRQLEQKLGFPWATRILGFIALGTLLFSNLVMKPRVIPKHKRSLVQLAAFKELPYLFFSIAMFMAFIGFYAPLYYLQTFAITKGITNPELGFYLLPILNAGSIPGRVIPNFIADHTGPINIMIPATIMTGTLAIIWISVHNVGGILAFAIVYGFFSGGLVSLPPPAIATLTTDMRVLGTRMGQTFFTSAFGLLIGSPAAGAIYTRTGSFLGLQLFSGLTLLVTSGFLIAARIAAVGWKPLAKT